MGRDTVFLKVESRLGYDFSGDIKKEVNIPH